jgi:microtubule-associated protein-like 6
VVTKEPAKAPSKLAAKEAVKAAAKGKESESANVTTSVVTNVTSNVSANMTEDDLILKQLYGEKKVYNKRNDTYVSEKDYVPPEGEQAGTRKKFAGTIVEPSKHPPHNPAVPEENYELEYVYGYRTHDCRQNLYFTSNGKIVYCAASIGIILDPQSNTQNFFAAGHSTRNAAKRYHDNAIVCLSISPDRKYAATGQAGIKPVLNIWDVETGALRCKYEMTEKNTKAIACCAWSLDGKYVAFADKK